MADRTCDECQCPLGDKSQRRCDRCKWLSRKRIPCVYCGEPTGWALSQADRAGPLAAHPRCHPVEHGTRRMYRQRGCRCDECRSWSSGSQAEWLASVPKPNVCERCGGAADLRFCSWECRKTPGSRRAYIPAAVRSFVYERDGWCCQLCGDPVDVSAEANDDWAATLDHIVPKSHQQVPDHAAGNLRLVHRWCNSIRADGRLPDSFFAREVV